MTSRLLQEGILDVKLPRGNEDRKLLKPWRRFWISFSVYYPPGRKEPPILVLEVAQSSKDAPEKQIRISRDGVRLFRCRSGTRPYRTWAIMSGKKLLYYFAASNEVEAQEWMQAVREGLWPPCFSFQMLTACAHEVSLIDGENTFQSGLLGVYGRFVLTSEDVISLIHPHWGATLLQISIAEIQNVCLVRRAEDSSTGVFNVVSKSIGENKKPILQFYCTTAMDAIEWILSKTVKHKRKLSLTSNLETNATTELLPALECEKIKPHLRKPNTILQDHGAFDLAEKYSENECMKIVTDNSTLSEDASNDSCDNTSAATYAVINKANSLEDSFSPSPRVQSRSLTTNDKHYLANISSDDCEYGKINYTNMTSGFNSEKSTPVYTNNTHTMNENIKIKYSNTDMEHGIISTVLVQCETYNCTENSILEQQNNVEKASIISKSSILKSVDNCNIFETNSAQIFDNASSDAIVYENLKHENLYVNMDSSNNSTLSLRHERPHSAKYVLVDEQNDPHQLPITLKVSADKYNISGNDSSSLLSDIPTNISKYESPIIDNSNCSKVLPHEMFSSKKQNNLKQSQQMAMKAETSVIHVNDVFEIPENISSRLLPEIPSDLLDTSINFPVFCQKLRRENSSSEEEEIDPSSPWLKDISEDIQDSENVYTDVVDRKGTVYEEIDTSDDEYKPPMPPELPIRPKNLEIPASLRLKRLSDSISETLKIIENPNCSSTTTSICRPTIIQKIRRKKDE